MNINEIIINNQIQYRAADEKVKKTRFAFRTPYFFISREG
jgi:hypothetical protein